MTTSGTTAFNLDFPELVEEAFERAGSELRTGYDLKTARRSMNLLLASWANIGINLWTIDSGTIPLVPGTATYVLPADTVDHFGDLSINATASDDESSYVIVELLANVVLASAIK